MNLIRCGAGHYYDGDKYDACPHCAGDETASGTIGSPELGAAASPFYGDMGNSDETVTVERPTPVRPSEKLEETRSPAGAPGRVQPVVGWVVCIEGPNYGQDFRLVAGRNFLGRGQGMQVRLQDNSVSRTRQAVVVYEPVQGLFLIQPGESQSLCYLNGQVVLETRELHAGDIITLGGTRLMFFPCCSESFRWKSFGEV